MSVDVAVSDEVAPKAAPDEETLSSARRLLEQGRLRKQAVSPDGTWLMAEAEGSGPEPYQVSVDLIHPNDPTYRCNCPSRKTPCKHALALVLSHTENPEAFATKEAGEELIAKREKKQARDEKKFGVAAGKKVGKTAQEKKLTSQKEGLDTLRELCTSLAASGQWFGAAWQEKLEKILKQFNDAHIPAASYALRKFVLLAKQKELTEADRTRIGAGYIAQMWAVYQRARQYILGKPLEGETQAENDALQEDIIGKVWSFAELREQGYAKSDLNLFEIAFERQDDEGRQQRVEISNLLELNSGDVYQAITYRPFKGLSPAPEQPSYMLPLQISEAVVYPGFLNRRVRWERGAEQVIEAPGSKHLEQAYEVAVPDFAPVVEEFRTQLLHPLAPHEVVFFLRCEQIGRIGDKVVMEDGSGTRIEAVDIRKDYSNIANLVRAVAMFGSEQPAIMVRLLVKPGTNNIVAIPLAAVTPKYHLRLGL